MLIIAIAFAINGFIVGSRAEATLEKASRCEDAEEQAALIELARKQKVGANVLFGLALVCGVVTAGLLLSLATDW